MRQYTILEAGAEGNNQYLLLLLDTTQSLRGTRIRVKMPTGQFITGWLPVLQETIFNHTWSTTPPVGGTGSTNMVGQLIAGMVDAPVQMPYRLIAVNMPQLNVPINQFLNLLRNKIIVAEAIYRPIFSQAVTLRGVPFNLSTAAQNLLAQR